MTFRVYMLTFCTIYMLPLLYKTRTQLIFWDIFTNPNLEGIKVKTGIFAYHIRPSTDSTCFNSIQLAFARAMLQN